MDECSYLTADGDECDAVMKMMQKWWRGHIEQNVKGSSTTAIDGMMDFPFTTTTAVFATDTHSLYTYTLLRDRQTDRQTEKFIYTIFKQNTASVIYS